MFVRNIYLRRRMVALATIASLVLAALTLWPAASSGARPPRAHVVHPGETVWAIASRAYDGDPRAHVEQILLSNRLSTASVRVGQTLVLP
jgi:nucleoid-associated protein YgaU